MLIFETFFRFFDTTIVETIADFEIPRCLKYNTREGKSEKKTVEAQKKFLKEISVKKQYKILLGLSLHTMQDYFAHCVEVRGVRACHNYYYKNGATNIKEFLFNKRNKFYVMFEMNDEIGISNKLFEDNPNVFTWRDELAHLITCNAISYWRSNKEIKYLYVTTRREFSYYELKHKKYYWSLNAMRCYLFFV